MRLGIIGKSLKGFLLLYQSCVMWVGEKDRGVFRKKLGKKLIKVFGGEKLVLYLAIGNDECEFWV
jgi:hypothetical protein